MRGDRRKSGAAASARAIMNLARLSRLLVRYRWPAAGLWLLLIGVCVLRLLTVPMGNVLTELKGANDTEAYQVEQILEQRFGYRPDTTAALVLKGPPPPELKPALQKHFTQLERIEDLPGRKDKSLRCWFLFFDTRIAFADIQVLMPKIRQFLDPYEAKPGLHTYLTGNAAFYNDFLETSQAESAVSDVLALSFAFAVLLFTFGGLVGALLPLLTGITTLLFFNGFLNFFQIQITPISMMLTSVLGLALSLDYAFFLVSRYQEEWDRNPNPAEALTATLKATGKTVLVSGLLVVLSSAVLMMPDLSIQRTNALNLVCVAAVATLNALLSLPALLLLTGHLLSWPTLLSHRFRSPKKYHFWQGFARHIVERPKRYFALSLVLLLGLAAPALSLRLWDPLQTMAPPHSESMQAYNLLQADGWGGQLIPIQVIVTAPDGDLSSEASLKQLYELMQAISRLPGVATIESPLPWSSEKPQTETIKLWQSLQTAQSLIAPLTDRSTLLLNVQQLQMMDILTSYDLIGAIRAHARAHPQLKILTGGVVARTNDFITELYSYSPRILGLVMLSILLVLMFYMKSFVLPLKASLMNFLPILSAFGILVLIFQDGVLADFLHLPHHGAIVNLVPLTLFCLIFGLSMDYEILIMSRITEAYEASGDVKEAIIEGLARSSSVITGAALILIMVFVPALFSQSAVMKEIALGIIAALVLDATLVRLLLVPSFMMLMGRWNWWNPWRGQD